MGRILLLSLAVLAGVPAAAAAQAHPHHTGKETRAIKALAEEDVQGLLDGQGMGYALAAELNRYPGPRHVLDLTRELRLTPEQSRAVQTVFEEMQRAARELGRQLVDQERKLDALFAERTIDEARLAEATAVIGRLHGELRRVHLRAHLQTTALLTPEQITQYDAQRGYAGDHAHHQRP